ncbi:Crp/Fnr family transcriptional regulator [Superficieibacter electus]|uniref:Crp/Fnr family transcriptional regulator n=1 Tax=Superficieibacter electus TaxID=2022662 RepID=A0A2P5GGQ7_9ENTR|nr:Crp/Fnr family transcriptional regulator [Superficieibacter electus]POP40996.1 Crp/Fnr family transcriptional regulator [Superficieibacter electus]
MTTQEYPFISGPHNTADLLPFQPSDFAASALVIQAAKRKGEPLYTQGQPVCGLWFLNSGVLGLYHTLDCGKDTLVRVYQAGQWFGFISLFGNSQHHCCARVLQNATVNHIIPHDNQTFKLDHPVFIEALIQQVAASLADAEHRLAWIARHSARHRVLSSLWYLTQRYPDYEWAWHEVAEFAGCETETALRFSKELKQAGILDGAQRRLLVRYPEKLAELLV